MTKSSIPIVSKELVLPFVLITSLFALWGFANAVTDPMVTAFKKVLELENFQASLVQMAFYGGYFTMALPAALFVKKYTYKSGVILGLVLYAAGAFTFYPAAVFSNFTIFLLGLYILTFGLAFLETTANPYILSMGDPRTATQRLNLAQSFNPVGLLCGLLIAQQFVLKRLQSDDVDYASLSASAKETIRNADLMVIRNPYVGIGLVVLCILLLIVFNKMPEKKDDVQSLSLTKSMEILRKDKKYVFGVMAQMFYVGVQIMSWTYIYHYAENLGISNADAGDYQFMAFLLFFTGRFVCTYLLKYLEPGKLLFLLAIAGMACALGTIFIQGMGGLYCLVATSFFMSAMFPTIYGVSLEGLKTEATKIGAAFLVMAIVGGALMPTLQGQILDWGGSGYDDISILGIPEVNFSFVLPLICFFYIAYYGYKVKSFPEPENVV